MSCHPPRFGQLSVSFRCSVPVVSLFLVSLIVGCTSDDAGGDGDSGGGEADGPSSGDTGVGGGMDQGMVGDLGVGADRGSNNDAGMIEDTGGMCTNLTLYEDTDMDGFGVPGMTQMACLAPGQNLPGYARDSNDCRPNDPLTFPGSEGVCGDYVDDDCNGADEPCPTTMAAGLDVPAWDCVTGAPPNNVYAYALFANNSHYNNNACFIFFEGRVDEFYARHTFVAQNQAAACLGRYGGCICPSSPPYDKRITAFTLRGTVQACPQISIIDHGGIACNECFDQPSSNECRKYLYPMHWFDIPQSFMGTLPGLQIRLERYPTIEIACVANPPNSGLTFASLLTATVQLNAGFVKK